MNFEEDEQVKPIYVDLQDQEIVDYSDIEEEAGENAKPILRRSTQVFMPPNRYNLSAYYIFLLLMMKHAR